MTLTLEQLTALQLGFLRAQGRNVLRQRLEALVNADLITLAGAQRVYHDVFGGTLVAVATR
jgi:hypothetical protein